MLQSQCTSPVLVVRRSFLLIFQETRNRTHSLWMIQDQNPDEPRAALRFRNGLASPLEFPSWKSEEMGETTL